MRETPDVAQALIATRAGRLRRADAWLEDASVQDLRTRLARRLVERDEEHGHQTPEGIEVACPLTQSDLAGMLSATLTRVNRLLAALQDDGVQRVGKNSFMVLQPDAVRERASR